MAARTIFGITPENETFTYYRVRLELKGKLIGGIPKDPDTIRAWVVSRLEGGNDLMWEQTIADTIAMMREAAAEELSTPENVVDPDSDQITDPDPAVVVAEVARAVEGGNGFKHLWLNGKLVPVLEGRCVKAMIREATNIAYPGVDWDPKVKKRMRVRKGAKSTLVERFFVLEEFIPLGVDQVSGTEQRIKHVSTPQGPRSAINVVDFIDNPTLTFHVAVVDDFLPQEMLGRIWEIAELNGLGADRARGDGVFELIEYARLDGPPEGLPVFDVDENGEKTRDFHPIDVD